MNWINITDNNTLRKAKETSFEKPVIIYKHSTRCNISSVVRNSLEGSWDRKEVGEVAAYFVDIINNRDISNTVAREFGVKHESPQLLLISNGACVYHTSHMGITFKKLKSKLQEIPL